MPTSPKRQRLAAPQTFDVCMPSLLKFGGGCSRQLPAVLQQLGLRRPFIVTDAFITKSGLLGPITRSLADAQYSVSQFNGCVPDPTTDSIAEGLRSWKACGPDGARPDCMVAIGGGSSIDTAKAISLLAVHGGRMRDYKAPAPVPAGLAVIAIPTTAGTGSEVTRATIITDVETSEKMLVMGFGCMPRAALVDHELTLSMPYRLTADSGLDALCHAMEAFVSKKHNAFSETHALAAMRAIPANLRAVCADLSDEGAREALMTAATHAGIAFSNASVTLIHGLSRPIGAHFHVPHGLSNAMLLPIVTEFSLPGAPSRYATCSRAMGFASEADDDDAAGAQLLAGLRSLCAELTVPSPCSYGIAEAEYSGLLELMADQALASGSPNNNPVVPTKEQCVDLYKRVYKGV